MARLIASGMAGPDSCPYSKSERSRCEQGLHKAHYRSLSPPALLGLRGSAGERGNGVRSNRFMSASHDSHTPGRQYLAAMTGELHRRWGHNGGWRGVADGPRTGILTVAG
eukprot:359159-Chlamydomonas_euryale.AAC.18